MKLVTITFLILISMTQRIFTYWQPCSYGGKTDEQAECPLGIEWWIDQAIKCDRGMPQSDWSIIVASLLQYSVTVNI